MLLGAKHQEPRLQLGLQRQRNVDGHLVAVEIGVESGAGQRMELNRFSFDQDRLKRLDAQTVERRRAVEHDRVVLGHLLQNIPDLGLHALEHSLGGLERDVLFLHQLADNERFEKLQGHFFGETALMELEIGTHHDHGTAGIVDPLTQKVLTEPALLSFQECRKGT